MKLVLIHGQNHRGSSYHIGRMLAETLQPEQITEFFLPRDLNHFCLGCCRCIAEEAQCPFAQEKGQIMAAVEGADLLIFTTPTYCLRASAPMKSFLDLTFSYWMSHRPRKAMFSKQAVVISTAAGTGMRAATKDVATALFYWGVPSIRRYGVAVQATGWEQVAPKKKAVIERDITRLARKLAAQRPRVGLKTQAVFFLMRAMQKAGQGASPEDRDYWQEQGWLAKGRPWHP